MRKLKNHVMKHRRSSRPLKLLTMVNDPRRKLTSLFTSPMDQEQPTATMASKKLELEMRAYERFFTQI